MTRSFTERIFGGVCGGIATSIGVSPWTLRILFVILAVVSLGAFALLYVMLWWAMPQESLVGQKRGGTLGTLFVLLLIVLVIGAWVGRDMGWLRGPTGQDLYWPAMLLMLSAIFLLRQVRA
jgi:phage shock protein PspC (stress-responsive transcriptional regulator)